MSDDELGIPRLSYQALAKRWGVSIWTVKSWVAKGHLPHPHYLSANTVRFTEAQARAFEQACPRDWQETQTTRKTIRQRTRKPRKRDRKDATATS